jgi:PASTA domain-containing protein
MAFDLKENPFKDLPKPVIIGGIAVTIGLTGFLLYRHHKSTGSWFGSGSASTASTAASAIDPVTGLPTSEDNAIDPLTGLTYLAEATQYGSVATAEASVSAYGTSSATGTGTAVIPADGGTDGTTTAASGSVSSPTYTSDAAWAQAVQAGLSDVSGSTEYDGTDIGTAIGDYLQGIPVTAAQKSVITTALAEYGNPPSGTRQIITIPTATAGKTMIKIPDLAGKTTEEATTELETLNLGAANPKGTPQTNIVTSTSPAAGTSVTPKTLVTIHSKTAPKKEAK